jgi:hypothetical protein
VNSVQLGLLALVLWAQIKGRWPAQLASAVFLGFLIAMKPNLFLVPFGLLLQKAIDRNFRSLASLAAGLAVGGSLGVAAAASFFGGMDCWFRWYETLPEVLVISFPVERGNFSLCQVLVELTGLNFFWPLLLTGMALLVLVLWQSRPLSQGPPSPEEESKQTLRVFLAMFLPPALGLLAVRLAWVHYFTVLAPLLLLALRPSAPQSVEPESMLPLYFRLAAFASALLLAFGVGIYKEVYTKALVFDAAALMLFLYGLWELVLTRTGVQQLSVSPEEAEEAPGKTATSALSSER